MRKFLIVIATLLGLAGLAWFDAEVEFGMGEAAYERGDLDHAIAHLTTAIQVSKVIPLKLASAAKAYYNRHKGPHDPAIADYSKAIQAGFCRGLQEPRRRVRHEEALRPGHRGSHQGDRAQAG